MLKDIGMNKVMKLHLTIRLAKKKSIKFLLVYFCSESRSKGPCLLVKSPAQYRG